MSQTTTGRPVVTPERPAYGYFVHYPWCEFQDQYDGGECLSIGCSTPPQKTPAGAFWGYASVTPPCHEGAPEYRIVVTIAERDPDLTVDELRAAVQIAEDLERMVGIRK